MSMKQQFTQELSGTSKKDLPASLPKKVKLPEILMDQVVPVVMKKELMSKLWFIISKSFDREWSGTLFCEVHGNIGDEDFKITAHDFFLQDIGSSGYTEYETDSTLIEYMESNPELLEYQRHKIHSHNTMSCFHSTTDMSDIHDNIEFYNFLLSVVINNKTEFDAKIATVGTISTPAEVIKLKGNEGDLVTLKTEKVDKDALFLYNCKVMIEADATLGKRIEELTTKRLEAEKERNKAYLKKDTKFTGHGDFYAGSKKDNFTKSNKKDQFVYNSFSKSNLKDPKGSKEINKSISHFLVKLIYMDMTTGLYDLQQSLLKIDKEISTAGGEYIGFYIDYVDTNLHEFMEKYFEWDDIYIEQENKVLDTMISLLSPYKDMSKVAEALIDLFDEYRLDNEYLEGTDGAIEIEEEEFKNYQQSFNVRDFY